MIRFTIGFFLSLAMLTPAASAQIERLDLEQMVARADGCVLGRITKRHVFRIDSPSDGEELYFTTLTIEGVALHDGSPLTVDVTHFGGFVSEEDGVWNSEAPSEEETRVGRRVLAFYRWTDNMGGGVKGNVLYASHGGLYSTFTAQSGKTIVQGRGEGFAVSKNLPSPDLAKRVAAARAKKQAGGK